MGTVPCPYCRQGYLTEVSRWALACDVAAKAIGGARIYFELRQTEGVAFRWINFGKAIIHEDGIPDGTQQDRRCPHCRAGWVSVESDQALWCDLPVRGLGLLRRYFELAGDSSRPPLSWRVVATVLVEGDEAKRRERRESPLDDDDGRNETPSTREGLWRRGWHAEHG